MEGCEIVQFYVDDGAELRTRLTARVKDEWVHITAALDSFTESASLRETYSQFANAVLLTEHAEEDDAWQDAADGEALASEDEENEDEKATDSGYASAKGSGDDVEEESNEAAKQNLQEWLLSAASDEISRLTQAKNDQSVSGSSLRDWYFTHVHFFEVLASKKDELVCNRIEDLDADKFIADNLVPAAEMPKYLTKLKDVPMYSPDEVRVVETKSDLHLSIHPTLVRVEDSNSPSPDGKKQSGEATHFLKIATEEATRSVRRELRILHHLDRKSLLQDPEHGIRAPRVEGLVAAPGSPKNQRKILGFLLTLIPSPATPLIQKVSEDIDDDTRQEWARESERMVEVLHENNVIWGDAKADNFMVDKDGKLWIIDFGGSYTEGWVDPELNESLEGDDMGVKKVVEVIEEPGEPSSPTRGAEEESQHEDSGNGQIYETTHHSETMQTGDSSSPEGKKRARSEESEEDSETRKRPRSSGGYDLR